MERKIEPDRPIAGNAYEVPTAPERALPATLWEAAQRLRGSEATREWEERQARKAVTDWQLARYFEII